MLSPACVPWLGSSDCPRVKTLWAWPYGRQGSSFAVVFYLLPEGPTHILSHFLEVFKKQIYFI